MKELMSENMAKMVLAFRDQLRAGGMSDEQADSLAERYLHGLLDTNFLSYLGVRLAGD